LKEVSTLIIGAGLAGLSLGRSLRSADHDHEVLILEKSPGLGGRIATRRIEDLGFDHGALKLNYLTSTVFSGLNLELIQNQENLWVKGGMNQLPKAMAKGLEIIRRCRATKCYPEKNRWLIETDTDEIYSSERVVLTAPLPQALELLGDCSLFRISENLLSVKYSKAILGLYITEDHPVKFQLNDFTLHSMKERGLHPHGFILSASETLAEANFELDDQNNLDNLTLAFQSCFDSRPRIIESQLKKWRYNQVINPIEAPFAQVAENFFIIGDAFHCGGPLGSLKSAEAIYKQISSL
jgi:renalase